MWIFWHISDNNNEDRHKNWKSVHAVPLIIVIPAIVYLFSIREYYMRVLYYHSLYRLHNF